MCQLNCGNDIRHADQPRHTTDLSQVTNLNSVVPAGPRVADTVAVVAVNHHVSRGTLPTTGSPTVPMAGGGVLLVLGGLALLCRSRVPKVREG
jgi:LPXTG-motif cell wall-anchored protein